jgi:hypothetical protein
MKEKSVKPVVHKSKQMQVPIQIRQTAWDRRTLTVVYKHLEEGTHQKLDCNWNVNPGLIPVHKNLNCVSNSYIIYSYKYLESDLIKHCHVIFIHSLGQPLIVRSHSKVHRSRGNPKEIPTWASRVSNYSYFPWFNRQQTWRHLLSVEKLQIF